MRTSCKCSSGAKFEEMVSKVFNQALVDSHVVIKIDRRGCIEDSYQNRYFAIDVISVVGPGLVDGEVIENALLLEIGMRRSKPYASVRVQNNLEHRLETLRPDDCGRCVIPERSRFRGQFLPGQFESLMSQLERVIHQIVRERVACWKIRRRELTINRATRNRIAFDVGPRMSFDLSDQIAGVFMTSDLKCRDRDRKEGSPLFARARGFKEAMSGAGEISAESIRDEFKIRSRKKDKQSLLKSLERVSNYHGIYPLHPHTVATFEHHLKALNFLDEFRMVDEYLELVDRPLVVKVDEAMRRSSEIVWRSEWVGAGVRRIDHKRVIVEFVSLVDYIPGTPILRREGWGDDDIPF